MSAPARRRASGLGSRSPSSHASLRVVFAVLIPIAAALLQSAVVPEFAIGAARPLLPVVVAASWSVAAGASEAVWWAFLGGLATDLLSGGPLGAFAVASLPAVAAVGVGDRSTSRPIPVITGVALVATAALIAQLAYVGILAAVGHPLPDLASLGVSILGAPAYGAVAALVTYPIARRLWLATEPASPF